MKKLSLKKAKITFTKLNGASGYTVYRAERKKGKYKTVKISNKTKISVNKLKKGKTYYFIVKGFTIVNGKKTYCKKSNIVKIKI